ncbi:MAG TPA: peptidoglycan recognition family protein [Aggregatilineales bacterium]|nr:N-acetylmuramoyl-L-alanine amidase [Anaerolineales bacterium]HRE47799.1 peptidoglycan recognition family protein [Aggregatilineales bacterium]
MKPPFPKPPPRPFNRPLTRREALGWIAMLGALGTSSLCGVGGMIAFLAQRRQQEANEQIAQATQTAISLPTPEPTIPAPTIIPRAAWGARQPNHSAAEEFGFAPTSPLGWLEYTGDLAQIYTTIAIHHSYPVRAATGTMAELQNMHMDYNQWADIGYHFGVAGDGTIYEGRSIRVRGASVSGHNTGVIGVVAIGDFENEAPALQQLIALQDFVGYLKTIYRLTHLTGHYEFNPDTACPGRYMRPHLDTIAYNTGLLRGTGGYIPPTPTPFPTKTSWRCC